MWLTGELNVWLYESPVDMRKSINGLSFVVAERLGKNPTESNEVFVFYNRNADKLKVLYWNRNGFCLFYKRLEKGRFQIPKNHSSYMITVEELKWLLDGLDISRLKLAPKLKYTVHF